MIKDNNQVNTKENLPNNDDKDYSIYNFLCQNVKYFIAIVTILITVFSYFVNHMSYAIGIAELKYWGIDPSAIAIYTQPLTYSVLNTIICFFLFSISFKLFSDAYNTYTPYLRAKLQLTQTINWYKSVLKQLTNSVDKLKYSFNEDQTEFSESESKIAEKIKECNDKIEQAEKCKKKVFKHYFFNFLQNWLGSFALLNIALTILFYTSLAILPAQIDQFSTLIIAFILLCCLVKYIKLHYSIKREVSKNFRLDDSYKIEMPTNEYLREKIASQGIKILLKNSFFHSMGKLVLLLLLFNLTAIYPLMNLMLITKKQFHLLQLEGKTYVSLYTNTRQTVLADAIIKNNNLSIVKNKHRIIATEGSQYKIVTFDKVQHIDTPDKQNVE